MVWSARRGGSGEAPHGLRGRVPGLPDAAVEYDAKGAAAAGEEVVYGGRKPRRPIVLTEEVELGDDNVRDAAALSQEAMGGGRPVKHLAKGMVPARPHRPVAQQLALNAIDALTRAAEHEIGRGANFRPAAQAAPGRVPMRSPVPWARLG